MSNAYSVIIELDLDPDDWGAVDAAELLRERIEDLLNEMDGITINDLRVDAA